MTDFTMETTVLTIDSPGQFEAAVARASALLRAGELVVLPTETVYGLAANALDESAVRKIFAVKGRPAHNPIIVHVSSIPMAQTCVADWPVRARQLAARFWPGPLTLVLPRSARIPGLVTAGGPTVGIRWPLHPLMRATIEACGFPLAAPSANLSNQISPTTGEHAREALRGRVPLLVDAGPANVGIESTVLDLTCDPPRVLRPGIISSRQIEGVLGVPILTRAGPADRVEPVSILKSPGLLARHYAPQARLMVTRWDSDAALLDLARSTGVPLSQIHVLAHEVIPRSNPFGRVAIFPHDPEAFARALYAELHRCDELGALLILVEQPPELPEWEGIRDRLGRAAA